MRRFISALSFACLLTFTNGCSTFHRDWTNAGSVPPPTDDFTGRWEGEWHSDANGHRGRLRGVVTRLDTGSYRARYRANWGRIFRFGHTVDMQAEESGGDFRFSGEADLGWLAGGVYHYDGWANATNFFANYQCRRDHGTFQMKRPHNRGGSHPEMP